MLKVKAISYRNIPRKGGNGVTQNGDDLSLVIVQVGMLRITADANTVFVDMAMPAFPYLNAVNGGIGESVGIGAHIGEHEIFAGQPIGGGILILGADVIMIHRADFFSIHKQPDHVRAVIRDTVFQTVGMQCGPIDAVVCQGDAIVMATLSILFTHSNNAVGVALENIPCIVVGVHIVGSEDAGAAGAVRVQEGTFAFPLYDPGQIMHKNDFVFQSIACFAEHTIGGSAGILRQSIAAADAGQVGSIKLPAVVLGLMDGCLRSDDHIIGDRFDGYRSVFIGSVRNVLAAHGHGNRQFLTVLSRQCAGESIAGNHDFIVTVVRRYAVQTKRNGVGIHFVSGVCQKRPLKSLCIGIHSQTVGMHPAIADIGVKIRHGNGAAVDIHDVGTEMLHNLLQLCIEGADQFVGTVNSLRDVQIVHLCIGITDGDLVQHDRRCFQGSGRFGIGEAAILIFRDQSSIVDISSAQGILIILEVIGAHLDGNDIGHFTFVVMKLDAAVYISTYSTVALMEQRGTTPGIVYQ